MRKSGRRTRFRGCLGLDRRTTRHRCSRLWGPTRAAPAITVPGLAREGWDNRGVAIAPTERAEPAGGLLPLPPGSLPVDSVRLAQRSYEYRAGPASAARLVEAVDTFGEVLEVEIARAAVRDMAEFMRCVRRLELLHARISMRAAQWHWLRAFPAAAPPAVPLMVRRVEVPRLLAALRGDRDRSPPGRGRREADATEARPRARYGGFGGCGVLERRRRARARYQPGQRVVTARRQPTTGTRATRGPRALCRRRRCRARSCRHP